MRRMFSGCTSFNRPIRFNTSNVTVMEGMFTNTLIEKLLTKYNYEDIKKYLKTYLYSL